MFNQIAHTYWPQSSFYSFNKYLLVAFLSFCIYEQERISITGPVFSHTYLRREYLRAGLLILMEKKWVSMEIFQTRHKRWSLCGNKSRKRRFLDYITSSQKADVYSTIVKLPTVGYWAKYIWTYVAYWFLLVSVSTLTELTELSQTIRPRIQHL